MKDNYGDRVRVYAAEDIYLTVHAGDAFADASLSPAKARKLAKKLLKAADEAEQVGQDEIQVGDFVRVGHNATWLNHGDRGVADWAKGAVLRVIEPVKELHGYRCCWVGEDRGHGQYVNVEDLTLIHRPADL